MKYLRFEEMWARKSHIKDDVLDFNTFERSEMYGIPLVVDIKPGELVDTGYPNLSYQAPADQGTYEFWHICIGAQHHHFEFRKAGG